MRACGASIGLPASAGDCCGALHAHSGFHDDAKRLAERVMQSCPGTAPIVVNSAGCGAALKHYGELLGNADARAFSDRVFDVHEWLASRLSDLPTPSSRYPRLVAVQDPCHLRHVQKAHMAVRAVLRPFADLVEIPDDGRCCGAGGSYQVQQPEMAAMIRSDKLEAIATTTATVVASANPGCSMWLSGDSYELLHPMQIIDAVLHGEAPGSSARKVARS
jgi:glycolate oxidase iron-sulfur subunit